MSELEEAIRDAAKSGRLLHLTLSPSKTDWAAGFKNTRTGKYTIVIKPDPVEALLAAIHQAEIEELL